MQGIGKVPDIAREDLLRPQGPSLWVYTNGQGLAELKAAPENYQIEIEQRDDDFRVGKLSLPFLNPKLRAKTTDERYLVRMSLP